MTEQPKLKNPLGVAMKIADRLASSYNVNPFRDDADGHANATAQVLCAILVGRAIDRLTTAVREDNGMVAAISELAESVRDNTRTLRGLDSTIDNAAMPKGHPAKRF